MYQWTSRQSRRKNELRVLLFTIFWDAFLACIAIQVALRLAGVEDIAMNYFWIAVAVFGICAIATLDRIQKEPEDTRLNTLIADVDALTKNVQTLTGEIKKGKNE